MNKKDDTIFILGIIIGSLLLVLWWFGNSQLNEDGQHSRRRAVAANHLPAKSARYYFSPLLRRTPPQKQRTIAPVVGKTGGFPGNPVQTGIIPITTSGIFLSPAYYQISRHRGPPLILFLSSI